MFGRRSEGAGEGQQRFHPRLLPGQHPALLPFLYLMRRFYWPGAFSGIALLCLLALPAQAAPPATPLPAGTISGRVTDASTGEALPGASIRVAGTSIGAATNIDGRYTIPNAPSGTQTLVVSYIGYEEQQRAVEVPDGGRLTADFALSFQTIEGEEVVVTAQVAGQLAAINEQFRDATVKNVVSRDRIQELPDNNAAESIGRLPGIAIQRSGGEANRVAIRGLSPKFNTVTVNGVRLPSTDGSDRSVDLSLVSSNILDGIEVRKAITPDMDADVVGGSIDLRLRNAPSGFLVDLLAQGGYTGLQKDYGNYKFVGTLSNRFWGDRLGAIATFNTDSYDRSADKLNVEYGSTELPDGSKARFTSALNMREETVQRGRTGGSILLDYRLPGGRITGNAFYNRLSNDALYRYFRPTVSNRTYNAEKRKGTTSVLTSALGMEQEFRWLKYDVQASYTRSRSESPEDFIWTFANDATAFKGVGNEQLVDLTPLEAYKLVKPDSIVPLSTLWVDSRQLDENQAALSLNLQTPFRVGGWVTGYVKAGGKLRWLDRTFDNQRSGAQGLQYPGRWGTARYNCLTETLSDEAWAARFEIVEPLQYLPINLVQADYRRGSDFLGGDFGLGIVPDDRLLLQLTRALQSDACVGEYRDNAIGSLGQDYTGKERYEAGYLMARFDLGRYVTLIPGVRFEGDHSKYTGQRFREVINGTEEAPPADLASLVNRRDNTYWLPMVHLDIRPTYWLSVRLARTETISRPSFNQYAPITSINTYGSYIQAANSQIRPATATNYDASLQVINNTLGLLGVSAFRKKIEHIILYNEIPARLSVKNGDTTRVGVPAGANVPDTWLKNNPFIQTSVNNEEPATFYGYEFEWQTNFSYLPGALKGIVLNLNYTRSFSETTYHSYSIDRTFIPGSRPPKYEYSLRDTTRTGRMPDQAAHIANITLGYDFKGFSTRISYLFQSNTTAYVNPINELADTFVGDYSRIDVSVRQKLREGFEVFANLNNLNNRQDRQFTYQKTSDPDYTFSERYPSSRELYGYTIDIGARYRF